MLSYKVSYTKKEMNIAEEKSLTHLILVIVYLKYILFLKMTVIMNIDHHLFYHSLKY